MAPSKAPTSWDDEESESTPPSSPPVIARRGKFDDEEDSDVIESWDAEPDSEEEREKAKKAAEAKAKAEAEAKANKKPRAQRIEEKRMENMRRRQEAENESSEEEEDEADKRARLRESEKASDMKNAEDLFGGVGGVSDKRSGAKPVTVQQGEDPSSAVDLSSLKLFNPNTPKEFTQLRESLVPLLNGNSKKPQYPLFLQEFSKAIVKDLSSEQVKKISSALTTISNEKMKEEKAAEKGGKKTKAAKTKTSLAANRDVAHRADVTNYDDGLGDDDFM